MAKSESKASEPTQSFREMTGVKGSPMAHPDHPAATVMGEKTDLEIKRIVRAVIKVKAAAELFLCFSELEAKHTMPYEGFFCVQRELEEYINRKERTVRTALRYLEDLGLIMTTPEQHKADPQKKVNYYMLNWGRFHELVVEWQSVQEGKRARVPKPTIVSNPELDRVFGPSAEPVLRPAISAELDKESLRAYRSRKKDLRAQKKGSRPATQMYKAITACLEVVATGKHLGMQEAGKLFYGLASGGTLQFDRLPEIGEPEAMYRMRYPRASTEMKMWLSVEAMKYPVFYIACAVCMAESEDPADVVRIVEGMHSSISDLKVVLRPSVEQAA